MGFKELKIKQLIATKNYPELKVEISGSQKYNFIVIDKIYEVLESNKDHVKKRARIRNLIHCLDDSFRLITIEQLIRNKNYDNYWLKDLLSSESIWDSIGEKQDEYILILIDEYKVPVRIDPILELYRSKYITNKQKLLIQKQLLNHIEKRPDLASSLGFYQHLKGTKILTTSYLEGVVISNGNAQGMYELMDCADSDKERLLEELGKIKDLSGVNKRFFLQAAAKHFPEKLAQVPFGEVIYQIKEEPTESYLENGWFDYAVNQMELLNKKEKNNGYSKTLNKKQ